MTDTSVTSQRAVSKGNYITGLDSIRFFCALWVVFFHGNLPPLLEGMDRTSRIGFLIRGVYAGAFNGPAAVIVFFLISGFCIHFPQRNKQTLRLGEFYARRSIRIGIPWLAASLMQPLVGIQYGNFTQGIGWSLIAEATYYAFYPLLLLARRKYGWTVLLSAAYAGSILVMLSNRHAVNYSSFGPIFNSVLGLPCWLLGCMLAENWNRNWLPTDTKPVDIRIWRFGVWAFTDVILAARYLGIVSDPWTLTAFSPLAYLWLKQEIRHFQNQEAPRLFEWAGTWSYSIYLIHLVGDALFGKIYTLNLGYVLNWAINVFFMLITCYLFYLLFERPSHKLAKALGKRLARTRAAADSKTSGASGDTKLAPLPARDIQ